MSGEEPTDVTAPPTLAALRALWMEKSGAFAGPSERYDREVNFDAWAAAHGVVK